MSKKAALLMLQRRDFERIYRLLKHYVGQTGLAGIGRHPVDRAIDFDVNMVAPWCGIKVMGDKQECQILSINSHILIGIRQVQKAPIIGRSTAYKGH